MSEMVLVVPVIALTAIVLVGILFVFRKYLALRDRLDAELAPSLPRDAHRKGGAGPRGIPKAQPSAMAPPSRHAA